MDSSMSRRRRRDRSVHRDAPGWAALLMVAAMAGCTGGGQAVDQVLLDSPATPAGTSTPTTASTPRVVPTGPIPSASDGATPTSSADQDGQLDCLDDSQFEMTSELTADATGFESPQRAVEVFLLERALADEVQTTSPQVGTIVIDGREVLRAEADQLADGTYAVSRYSGCANEPPGPEGTTAALAQPCPSPRGSHDEQPTDEQEEIASPPLFDVVVVDGGRQYSLRHFGDPVVLGAQVGVTECRIADGAWPDARLRSGDATLLPVGTPLFAVEGQPVAETIAADSPGGALVYQYVALDAAAPLITPSPAVPAPEPVETSAPQATAEPTPTPAATGSG
jgi:hypothetical protein